ncbi:prolipoprotein diacylglyceryl transferase [Nonomuraea sp. FMUSA5-5]|uniref:Phosphatidylglycerol--prolipoprotein diacylglyceryl transferase n=1 Tax=Nonomuraea composti TaxID=2720023 RepID=A0ABX1BNC7_9ACTN|nr:prolipoprotein diacylglyceryl transferase [Nonomuraea sp. FMUSA5-5]NJP97321.1 prolipoprotein diacylglyceryl transferase [Nonomuraea sp. FMUSA5-5]
MPLASIPSPSQGVWYLGIIPIRAYALCIVLGVIVAVWLSERRWRARGGQRGTIIDIAVPAVIFGLIGGRLYHVITDWQTYFGSRAIKEPIQALFIWEGGLGIWGAIALGGVGVWWAARRRGLSMTALADTIAPGIAFAQAIGRWGNWFNQELYGSPTTLPWGLEIDVDHGGEPGVLYHPTFLYESLWDVALGFVLIFLGRRLALHHGRLFALYVAGYTLGRFWIEGLRIDPVGGVDHAVTLLGLRLNQWTSIVLFVGALVYFWATRNKTGEEIVVPPSADPDPAHSTGQADPGPDEPSATSEKGAAEEPGETGEPGADPAGSGTDTKTETEADTEADTEARTTADTAADTRAETAAETKAGATDDTPAAPAGDDTGDTGGEARDDDGERAEEPGAEPDAEPVTKEKNSR